MNRHILFLKDGKVIGRNRIESSIQHGKRRFEPGFSWNFLPRQIKGISDSSLFNLLHIADNISNLPWKNTLTNSQLRLHHAHLKNLICFAIRTTDNSLTFLQFPSHHIEQTDNVPTC